MSEPSDPLRLAELVCARMSHDLGGTIGTLAGALELAEDPAVAAEALALASQAATELRQRLELQRASWGPTAGPLDLAGIAQPGRGPAARQALHHRFFRSAGRHRVFPPFARVLLNLLLLAADSLNGSGEVTLAGSGTDLIVAIAGHAGGLARAASPASLASEAAAWAALRDARSLQMPLTALLARALGLRLSAADPGRPGRPRSTAAAVRSLTGIYLLLVTVGPGCPLTRPARAAARAPWTTCSPTS